MLKYNGFVEYVLLNDNSVGISAHNQQTINYFVNRIYGKAVTVNDLEALKSKEVSFIIFREGDTSVTAMIDIVE